ncbi:DUF2163 domain-containing protein [Thalassovita taeanensis]|uniref:Bacteriophage phiJL001 Gp84 C-terminal domain-containing protein n=1 Tax=Thalassovita taeanensis TaxID=657014 RepID=A0A1H9HPH3_9RHOB|nr:DUF2163 domain-containing protein [Thalassovita taeanensis]SEQ64213.1 phage conserved hypothetical protein BR0599 [Thalassovita taeanensis]
MKLDDAFLSHLQSGVTTLCRCWSIRRKDGETYGFTDHDLDLKFEGIRFKADTGLSAMALQQGTGLSVDNTEALGALSDAAVSEEDIEAGRFDAASVRCWLVNWADVAQRALQFNGMIGELSRAAGGFQAELRGLTDMLNQPVGRVYQRPCTAVFGDTECGFDAETSGYTAEIAVEQVDEARVFRFAELAGFDLGWFQRGSLAVLDGAAGGLKGAIKQDHIDGGQRVIELWAPLRAEIAAGDHIRLTAGCDKRFATCRLKFDNVMNFQGFPDIPGDDWTVAYPGSSAAAGGGSRR